MAPSFAMLYFSTLILSSSVGRVELQCDSVNGCSATTTTPQTSSLILSVCLGVGIPVVSITVILVISLTLLYLIRKRNERESGRVEDSESIHYKASLEAQGGSIKDRYSRETLMMRASTVHGALLDVNLSPRSGTLAKRIESGNLLNMSPKQRLQNLEFPHGNICIVKDIGGSNFGKTYIGEASGLTEGGELSTTVFIKSLGERAPAKVRLNFTIEMTLASGFNHVNILSLLAVCNKEEPRYMVFEYLEYGALNTFLQSIDSAWLDLDKAFDEAESTCASSNQPMLGMDDLTTVALQVADGMEYLASKAFVHKDIAARNCQVGQGLRVKISSFGLSYDPQSKDYCVLDSTKNTPVPLRWLAPEALRHKSFSIYSNVWSYGVFIWEVFSFGAQPYSELSNAQVVTSILNYKLLTKPENCPESIYKVMLKCWHKSPAKRLDFTNVSRAMGNAMINLDPEDFKMFGMERSTPEMSRRL